MSISGSTGGNFLKSLLWKYFFLFYFHIIWITINKYFFFRNSVHLIQFSTPTCHSAGVLPQELFAMDKMAAGNNSGSTVGLGLDSQLIESDRESCV